jgi:sigma-E factor negative regulatory protein RseA
MNDMHKEQISSLLDNELDAPEASELLAAIEADQGLNKQFDRYALIRDALNEDVVVHQESFLKSVQDALVTEPTVLAPSRKKRQDSKYTVAAIAASVAIFTVLIFDVGLFTNPSPVYHSVASLEAEQDEMLALEEQETKDLLENEGSLDTQFVTFEK